MWVEYEQGKEAVVDECIEQISSISFTPVVDGISRQFLQSIPSSSKLVDDLSKITSFDTNVTKRLSDSECTPDSGAGVTEYPLSTSSDTPVELVTSSLAGLSYQGEPNVPEEGCHSVYSEFVEPGNVREISTGADILAGRHQTVIPGSTVGTPRVPISEDGECQSDIVGSQASVSTFSDVSDEPRRPFLSKSRREQLSILTKRVLSEKEMKELMIEVKEVTRQIKQEVKELKPDLTPTPEGVPFPSQAFVDDSESSLASIIEEHPRTSDASRKALTEKSITSSSHDITDVTLPKTSPFSEDKSLHPGVETNFEGISPLSDTDSKPSISSESVDQKDVKFVIIFEEDVILDDVMETVVDEIQTVEKKVAEDSGNATKSHEYVSVSSAVSQSSSHGEVSDDDEQHCSTDDMQTKSEIREAALFPKVHDTASALTDTTILPKDSHPLAEIKTTVISDEEGHIECTSVSQAVIKELDFPQSTGVGQSSTSVKADQVEERESSVDVKESSELPLMTMPKDELESEGADESVSIEQFPIFEEAGEAKSPQRHLVCPYSGDSHHFRPILDVTSEDIVLKDDDTIEITVSEDPSQIYSTTSTHDTVETTMHTSSSGATFVEVTRDGQRSICVCEKIVQSQTLVPKESTSRVKHPPETLTTSKKPSTSGISKTRSKESSTVTPAERKRSMDTIKASSESQDSIRKRPISKPSMGSSDSEGITTKKKTVSKSIPGNYVHPTSESHRKMFSSTYSTHPQVEEPLPRERSQKRSHYAEDTASSSSKKVTVTHRREESQYSRSYRLTRDSSDSSDKSPAFHKSSGRRDGDLDQSYVPRKRSQEVEKRTPGKDEVTKDRFTSSKKLTLPSIPGPSQEFHTEAKETITSRKTSTGKVVQSKLPRSSIPTKKKETSKGDSDVPTFTDTPASTAASSVSLGRHSTSTVTQRISSTRISERTIGTTTKQTRKMSQSKVPKPTKSSLEIQTSTLVHKIPPTTVESHPLVTPKLPPEDARPEVPLTQTSPKVVTSPKVDSSPESSVTVMTSTPSPSLCQPSFGIPDSSSPTPSLPSSPSRMRHSSAASGSITQLMTSEVFTRTLDVTGAIEVIYRQPTTSESLRRIAPSKSSQLSAESTVTPTGAVASSQMDSSQIDTTDSSLSDSIAIPSSSSDLDFSGAQDGYRQVLSRSGTFAPQRTSHPTTPSHLSPSPSSILSQPTHRRTVRTTQVSEERLSPILDVRAVTPPRVKHKFEYVAGDEVEEAGEHPQGKRLAPHHSARCHQLFSTSASVQSMASDLEQIISNVRKAFWPPQFSSERTDQLLSVLESRAKSLTKLADDFPSQFGLAEAFRFRWEGEKRTSTPKQ
ncbi:serine-rich adhesin for platelets-like [Hetaerina americana]|uniref:serine-rich adhesin for platelets-like n=1 Tax=Hetaerina americana TaxID=62018 RepID=UPI003A7F3D6E